jgi:hypothetical protein
MHDRTETSEHLAPSDRLLFAGAGAAALWVILWVGIQLRASLDWTWPPLPFFT